MLSSVSATSLGTSGLAAAALLPLVEANPSSPDAAWLTELVRHVLTLVERIVPVKVFPVHIAGHLPAVPLTIWPAQPLLIIPFTSAQNSHMTGEELLHSLGLDERLRDVRSIPLRPLRPTLTELVPLNVLGGWVGGSHAELIRLMAICPGWDEEISLKGPVCVLRAPLRVLPTTAEPPQSAAYQLLLRTAYSTGQTLDPLARLDVQIVVRYLACVLVATIRAAKASQGLFWRSALLYGGKEEQLP